MDSRTLQNTPVAILAGGLATRLGLIAETIPKAMVPVGGRPFLEHQLEYLRSQGVRRVVICAGHLGERIVSAFGDGAQFGIQIDYSFDGEALRGTAGALRHALPLLGDAFFVLYGDSWLPTDFGAVRSAFVSRGAPALMTVFHNRGRWDRSNVWLAEGRILAYDKRNPVPEMEHIDYGLSVLTPAALGGDEADLADVFMRLAPGSLTGFEVHERFYEIGSPAGLEELRHVLC